MKKNLDFYCLWLFNFENDKNLEEVYVSQRYGSKDPDPHPDPYKNVTDPEHWKKEWILTRDPGI